MVKKGMVRGFKTTNMSNSKCLTCAKGKISVHPFPHEAESRSKELLEIIHSDICGPINQLSIGGSKYFITFIDDCSRYMQVYFLKRKEEAFDAFKTFKAMVENELERKIKILRSDNGGEYTSKVFTNFLKENGIQHQLTVPHTPQQNGVAERANRTLVEMARCMLIHSSLGEKFWAEAINTSVYLRNRAETKALSGKTPFEKWTGKVPSVSHLKVFGSFAVCMDKTKKHKFQAKGREVIMVGYSTVSKAYRLYEPKTSRVIVGRDVIFISNPNVSTQSDKTADILKLKDATEITKDKDIVTIEIITEENKNINEPLEEINNEIIEDGTGNANNDDIMRFKPGRPKILRSGKPGRPRKLKQMYNCREEIVEAPTSVKEALSSKYSEKWKESMEKEYNALIKNETWKLVDLPEGEKVIGCKWVFNMKRKADGSIDKFKSRLVAKGCAQKFGVNYTETFSPVVRYATIRMIIALASEYGLYLHQMDVSSAYLNGTLKDTVYMKQPEQFISDKYPKKVCKLIKSLYGLKQSGREWNEKLDFVLKNMGFVSCPSEPCVYVKNNKGNFNIIAVYVDDLLIACSKLEELNAIKSQIASEFEVVDGGKLHYYLNMEVNQNLETGEITLCQTKYINDLLEEYGMVDCKSVTTPMDPGFQVTCSTNDCERMHKTKYQSLIGALMYLAISSRPDILHPVSKLAQCNMDPHVEHFTAAKRIIRYLKGTKDFKLHYHKTGLPINCYVDADWGGDSSDRKSYTGCVFILAGGVFSWQSKKQGIIALSSTEAEYVALTEAAKEAVYIMKLTSEMGFKFESSMVLNSDNQSAQQLIKNPVFHSRSKHIDIKYHYIRELYKRKEINLSYCPTEKMIADILTKSLQKVKHNYFTNEMGVF